MLWLAAITALTLAAIAMWHVYWALGGTRGLAAAIPQRENHAVLFTPGPWGTLAVAGGLGALAVMALGGGLAWPPAVELYPALAMGGGVFALRVVGDFRYVGVFKKVRGTRFSHWDDRLFTPLCLALAAACWALAYGFSHP